MIMPLFDDNSDRQITPIVNYLLIAINVWVFIFFEGMGDNEKFIYTWSTVPRAIVTGKNVDVPAHQERDPETGRVVQMPGLQPTPISVYLTLLTSMFMHGGWAHILGNMLFLWIFGDNVEDVMGHGRYLAFYLLCGIIASLCHVFMTVLVYGTGNKETLVPSLGASGAISGVMGAYLLRFPNNRVTVLLLRILTTVPAWVAVGMWFVMQLVMGIPAITGKAGSGGVAYAAHIGGFIAGMVLVNVFAIDGETRPITAPPEPGPPPRDEPW
jgi:membrane associated rhomboid family serine protease